ncbi:MAG: AraC family transcriptional regulator [Kangiellaceae bacterium]|nr:AraC family transcriptional regulator [Kangiellaceae bacterium]
MDIISKILQSLHFDANIYLHSEFCSPWGLQSDNPSVGTFHVIAYGHCTIQTENNLHISLNAGDLIFFPKNIKHKIENTSEGGISTTLICGSYQFSDAHSPLISALPDFIHIKANELGQLSWFESLIKQIVNEAESGTEGRSLILDKLAEILFVYIIRYYVLASKSNHGVLAGLADKQLSKALFVFHNDMGNPWSVETLAQHALMSRSAFSDKFAEVIQMTPMQYVTYWRMQCAYNQLTSTNTPIISIALDHGYKSEAAFSKVFKKQFAISPGKARKLKQ